MQATAGAGRRDGIACFRRRSLTMDDSFVCGTCGKVHAGLPRDEMFRLPDDVWAIPEPERSERSKFTTDLCRYNSRYFIRCVLYVPFTEAEGEFGWGVWVEVDWPIFERYLTVFDADAAAEPAHSGKLANALPSYPGTAGAHVLVQFSDSSQRPLVYLPDGDGSEIAIDQRQGIDQARYHEILRAVGVLK